MADDLEAQVREALDSHWHPAPPRTVAEAHRIAAGHVARGLDVGANLVRFAHGVMGDAYYDEAVAKMVAALRGEGVWTMKARHRKRVIRFAEGCVVLQRRRSRDLDAEVMTVEIHGPVDLVSTPSYSGDGPVYIEYRARGRD